MRLRFAAVLATALFLVTAAPGQDPEKRLACSDRAGRDERPRTCEMRENTIGTTGRLNVDAGPNGGVAIRSWSRAQVLVRAKVETWGSVKPAEVIVNATPGKVASEGPRSIFSRDSGWSVSYEIFLPERTDLELSTVNGGVSVAGVRGDIVAKTTNGGISLDAVGGRVQGRTTNGGITLKLAGNAWDGESCELSTTNGGISVDVPANYSARFSASTTNGGLKSELPNSKVERGRWTGGSLEAAAGSGGALIKATTTNGGVTIRQRGAA
jgi:hypothetical protein